MNNHNRTRELLIFGLLATLTGCTVHPPGEREERDSALQAGKPFGARIEERNISPLPLNPTPDQLVEYALLNNAEVEQHYWEWRSAIDQIPQDGSQTTSLNLVAGTSIANGRASWGSSTLALANDPMTDIKWPSKLDAAARQSLENAKAAGRRFIKAKFDLRLKVLIADYDYALTAELIRLEQSNQQLLQSIAMVTQTRSSAGSSGQQDVLKADDDVDMSANEISSMQSQLPGERAAINALLSRAPDAPLPVPTELPPKFLLAHSDAELVDLAGKQNPELNALADEIRGREEGVRLARLQYLPDFNLSGGTDLMGVTQSVLGQATIPIFRYEALNAGVAQARDNVRAAEAMRRQTGNDLAMHVVMDIATIHETDRQLDLFERAVLPRAREIATLDRTEYETGHTSLLNLLDDQRALISTKRVVAGLKIAQAKSIAELESITAIE